jgi:hypothetical protein
MASNIRIDSPALILSPAEVITFTTTPETGLRQAVLPDRRAVPIGYAGGRLAWSTLGNVNFDFKRAFIQGKAEFQGVSDQCV